MSQSQSLPSPKPKVWRLRAGQDKRFRGGHPWVYSNELAESPKGIEPGAPIELQDAGGGFIARGYGNPGSLIAFRAISRDPEDVDPWSAESLHRKLAGARELRVRMGLGKVSYRLCFGEADQLPGLIIDRFKTEGENQVFVIQAQTAGMDRLTDVLVEALQKLVEDSQSDMSWAKTAVIVRGDAGARGLEGIPERETKIAKRVDGIDFSNVPILIASAAIGGKPLMMLTDLREGQKTGFFLDQSWNIQLAAQRLGPEAFQNKKTLRILDLCCYVGQWGAQFANLYKGSGKEIEVVAVDASAKALEFAKRNVEAQGARCETIKGDVMKDLAALADQSFDIVICDPPALIKGRKDIPVGTRAYLQLNTQVFRVAKPGAGVVSCSCSALLDEEEFVHALSKAAQRNKRQPKWVARGAQAPDHPVLTEFPEGRYLKAWIGVNSK